MCGWVAMASRLAPIDSAALARMAGALAHRGPDGEGQRIEARVGLAHRRLAIIDPAGGAQPLTRGGVTVVFNGALFNHPELREELGRSGYRFESGSDTEVLLQAYLAWGEDCLERFEGMFAFALHDPRTRTLLVARDAFGIKPVYWTALPDRLIWASEIKALLLDPEVPRRLDPEALDDYLLLQTVPGESTLFAGIQKLPPAHLQRVDLTSLRVQTRRWWQRTPPPAPPSIDVLRDRLHTVVARAVRADVPVGIMLSGGLDSSAVAAIAAQAAPGALKAWTGAYREGAGFDESPHAQRVAAHLDLPLQTVWPQADEWVETLPRLARAMDEPAAGPGVFGQYAVARAARAAGIKVLLGGQGGDELFAGYARHLALALGDALDGALGAQPSPEGLSLVDLEPGLGLLAPYRSVLSHWVRPGESRPESERFLRTVDRRTDAQEDGLSPALRDPARVAGARLRMQGHYESGEGRSPLQRALDFELKHLLPALLQVEDRTSMAVGVESRVPLLDPRLACLAAGLPDRELLAGGRTKAALRAAVAPWLPAETVARTDKMGFPMPLQQWLRGPGRSFVGDVFNTRVCRERGLFEVEGLLRLLDAERPHGRALWGALQIELWHREMIDRSPVEDARVE